MNMKNSGKWRWTFSWTESA